MDFDLLDDNMRRKMIIDYVNNHELCTREEIVKSNEVPISRAKIFDLVKELLKEGVLVEIREKINSRDHKLVINKTSLLFSVPEELDQFKDAYINLIRNFKSLTETKSIVWDVTSTVSNSSSISSDLTRMSFELTKASSKIGSFCNAHKLGILIDRKFYEELNILINRLECHLVETLDIFHEIKNDKSVNFMTLKLIAGGLYYLMYDNYFHHSLFTWSNRIQDREALKKLIMIFYSAMVEMHLELANLFGLNINADLIPLNITEFRNVDLNDWIFCYIIKFGIDKQLDTILNIIPKISVELKSNTFHLKPNLYKLALVFEDELDKAKEALLDLRQNSKRSANDRDIMNKLKTLENFLFQIWVTYLAAPA